MSTIKWDYRISCLKLKFPKFQVKRFSDSKIMSFVYKHFLSWAAAVTVGNTVYFSDKYYGTDRGATVLKHEGAHVADWNKWWIIMPITYALLLPAVFTMRAVWEWHGYREDLRDIHEEYSGYADYDKIMSHYIDWVVDVFAGKNYLFMFPFRKTMRKICEKYVASLGNSAS